MQLNLEYTLPKHISVYIIYKNKKQLMRISDTRKFKSSKRSGAARRTSVPILTRTNEHRFQIFSRLLT